MTDSPPTIAPPPDFIASAFPPGAAFARFTPPGQQAALAYMDAGAGGPPVVCVHGNPTWGWLWRGVARAVSPDRRVVVPDHVGMGRSDKPADYPYRLDRHAENLRALWTHLNLSDITLVCHDWGGPIGLLAAVREPGRVGRVVLSNTAAFRSDRMPWQIALARSPVGELLVRGPNLFVRGLMR